MQLKTQRKNDFYLFVISALCLLFSVTTWAALPGTIAMIQDNADSHFNDYEHNMKALTKFAALAIANHAKIIVFPEGSTYGYADSSHFWCKTGQADSKCLDVETVAEKIPGGRTEAYWSRVAQTQQVYVLFNLPEIGDDGHYYNTTGISGPHGYVSKYRKRSLYRTDEYYATPAEKPVVLETEYGNFGIAICLDGTYAGILEAYKAMGTDAVILPMDWDDDPHGPYAAKTWFTKRAGEAKTDIFVSDQSSWDGSGMYLKNGSGRVRDGLAEDSIAVDGITYAHMSY